MTSLLWWETQEVLFAFTFILEVLVYLNITCKRLACSMKQLLAMGHAVKKERNWYKESTDSVNITGQTEKSTTDLTNGRGR